MSTSYKDISCQAIAHELGIEHRSGHSYRCFSPTHPDKNPSLVIYEERWRCEGCGLGDHNGGYGNNVELVKAFLGCPAEEAIRWISDTFNCGNESLRRTKPGKQSTRKLHLRFINGTLTGEKGFRFSPESNLALRPPTLQDVQNIREALGKSYSLQALEKAKVKINEGKRAGYALVFEQGQLEYNPGSRRQFLHLEGRTDYLTAIEMGLDAHYGIVSDFNKTAKVLLPKGNHHFIMDADVSQEDLLKRLMPSGNVTIKTVRLPEGVKDLSDFYNEKQGTGEDIVHFIEEAQEYTFTEKGQVEKTLPPRQFKIYTGSDLLTMNFPEPRWGIPGLLPEGLTILAGRPKSGKSWMALGWCLSVAMGGKAMSRFDAEKGKALYVALEDKPRRLSDRLRMTMLGVEEGVLLHDLLVMTEFQRFDEDGDEQLKVLLEEKPGIRLAVIAGL